jgi:Family of unknown function (DUF5519)
MTSARKFEEAVSAWPDISAHAHRFGGKEFLFGKAEVGHVHWGGNLDIPFTRAIRDALLEEGLAEEHRWVPNSGWITFRIRSNKDLQHALWLMRLSYLRYAVKTASDPNAFFHREAEKLHLNPRFRALLQVFVPRTEMAS